MAGNDIVHLTAAGRALFVAAVAPDFEEQRRRLGGALFDYLAT